MDIKVAPSGKERLSLSTVCSERHRRWLAFFRPNHSKTFTVADAAICNVGVPQSHLRRRPLCVCLKCER